MAALTVATTGTVSGLAENTQINAVVASLATMQAGGSAPTATSTGLASTAGVWWHDTADSTIRVRNQADTAWVTIGTINETTNTFTPAGIGGTSYLPLSGGTLTGGLVVSTGGVDIVAGGLTVVAGGASIAGNSSVAGTWSVSGAATFGAGATFAGAISAAGQITSTSAGFKFPDGSVQTTAFLPASYATTASLGAYAPLASPALAGTPTTPTPAMGNNGAQIPNTAWVQATITAAIAAYAASGSTTGGTSGGA